MYIHTSSLLVVRLIFEPSFTGPCRTCVYFSERSIPHSRVLELHRQTDLKAVICERLRKRHLQVSSLNAY